MGGKELRPFKPEGRAEPTTVNGATTETRGSVQIKPGQDVKDARLAFDETSKPFAGTNYRGNRIAGTGFGMADYTTHQEKPASKLKPGDLGYAR